MRLSLIAVAACAALAACTSPEVEAPEPADAPAALKPGRPAMYEAARVGHRGTAGLQRGGRVGRLGRLDLG